MGVIRAAAPSPALRASSCIFSGCGKAVLTKPRLKEPSQGALDGVAPRQQMSSSPSRDAGTTEGGDTQGRVRAHLQTGTQGLVLTAPQWAEDRRIHPSPSFAGSPARSVSPFPVEEHSVGPTPVPEPFPGCGQPHQNLTPLCALGFGDACERHPAQSRAVLRAPLPASEACLLGNDPRQQMGSGVRLHGPTVRPGAASQSGPA